MGEIDIYCMKVFVGLLIEWGMDFHIEDATDGKHLSFRKGKEEVLFVFKHKGKVELHNCHKGRCQKLR